MIDPVLFLIPARAGSRRVPGKNLRTVSGIPLVARAVRVSRRAAASIEGGPHLVVCSTDDPAIAALTEAWHAFPAIGRPAALAGDDASSADVAVHALDVLAAAGRRFRRLVLVQPTSPLTDPADIVRAVERADTTGSGVVSVTPSHPVAWHQRLDAAQSRLEPVERTGADAGDGAGVGDDAGAPVDAASWLLTGAFYVVEPDRLRETRRFAEPGRTLGLEVPPWRSVDIDEPHDLAVAEAIAAAGPTRSIVVAGHDIGAGRCFVIAEAGINHDGDPEVAHRLIDAAADAGADAVKFQTFRPDRLATVAAPLAAYQRTAGGYLGPADGGGASGMSGGSDSQRAMLERYVLPDEAWPGLQSHAADRGIVFLSSPFDEASADLLDRLDVPAYKVPSGELTNLPFLRHLARTGRPLLVSTGMADLREVADAVDAVAAAGDPALALFHCVSAYPADPGDANLAAMATMRAAFGVPVGWSDHTLGTELAVASAALGAELLEKHLTLGRDRPGPDHRASIEPAEFAAMVAAVRAVESARGDGRKVPTTAELATAAVARKSLHWARAATLGDVVRADDLVALRPGIGVSPAALDAIVGRRLAREVREGQPLDLGDIEDGE